MHKQVHDGCREASEEWEKAEMALSQVLKSKKRMKDRLPNVVRFSCVHRAKKCLHHFRQTSKT